MAKQRERITDNLQNGAAFVKSKLEGTPLDDQFKDWLSAALTDLQRTGRETWPCSINIYRLTDLELLDGRSVNALEINFVAFPEVASKDTELTDEQVDYIASCMVKYQCGIELGLDDQAISFIVVLKQSEITAAKQLTEDFLAGLRLKR